jgi:DNA-binding MarR family transcriptional regulator
LQLRDLLEKPINELTDAELEDRLNSLKRLKIMSDKPPKIAKVKSNKDKQIADLLSGLSPEDIQKLLTVVNGG